MTAEFFSLDYQQQKSYIEELLKTSTFREVTNDLLSHISFDNNDYNLFMTYLNILSDLYDDNSIAFFKDNQPVFDNKQDLGIFIIFLMINELIKKSPNNYKYFFENYLSNLNMFNINSFNLISGDKEKGFQFDYLLYIPSIIENNTLIVEGNNTPTNYTKGELNNPIYVSETLFSLGSFQYFLDLNAPIFIPLISNDDSTLNVDMPGYHERYARQLSRNSVNPDINTNPGIKSTDDYIYRTDIQILNAIGDAKRQILNKAGIQMEDKSFLYGFSTSGNLAVRLAFLHPKSFCGVIAGGINAAIPLPLNNYNNINLLYPVGTYDYSDITGEEFNLVEYANLNQYYFMGSNEEPSKYNTVIMPQFHDEEIIKTYKAISLDLNKRANNINSIYNSLGLCDKRIEIFEGYGHTPDPAENRIKEYANNWIKENGKRKNR